LQLKESAIYCPKCGNAHDVEGVFCIYCGTNIESVLPESKRMEIPEISQSRAVRVSRKKRIENTLFCPKCNCENLRTNLECKICGEDFSKYNFRDIRTEFSITQVKKEIVSRQISKGSIIGAAVGILVLLSLYLVWHFVCSPLFG